MQQCFPSCRSSFQLMLFYVLQSKQEKPLIIACYSKHTRPTFPSRAMHLPLNCHHQIYILFLDQWLLLCLCLFDVLKQWNFILPSKPTLFITINYHTTISRACSFGSTACAHLLFGVCTNYVITLWRMGTNVDEDSAGSQRGCSLGKEQPRRSRGDKNCGKHHWLQWVALQPRNSSRDWRCVLGQGNRRLTFCLFLCKGFNSFSLDTSEDSRVCPQHDRAVRQALSSVWVILRDTDRQWVASRTHYLLLHWRGSEIEGVTAFCKVIREVRANQRLRAKLHEK